MTFAIFVDATVWISVAVKIGEGVSVGAIGLGSIGVLVGIGAGTDVGASVGTAANTAFTLASTVASMSTGTAVGAGAGPALPPHAVDSIRAISNGTISIDLIPE